MPTDIIAVPLAIPAPRLAPSISKAVILGLLLLAVCVFTVATVSTHYDAYSAISTVAGP